MDGDTDLEPEPIESYLAGFENCYEQADEVEIVSETKALNARMKVFSTAASASSAA
jgi:hypothetical protein